LQLQNSLEVFQDFQWIYCMNVLLSSSKLYFIHCNFLHLITLIISGEEYKLWSWLILWLRSWMFNMISTKVHNWAW
jgi:hypothetical protein